MSKEIFQKYLCHREHENSRIPESVSKYIGCPLYIIIALWCQQQNRWINRNDIAQAFSIPVRKASFQLSYMTRRPRHIVFLIRKKTSVEEGKRHPYNEIWVKNVMVESVDKREEDPERAINKARRGRVGAYRSRVGNGMHSGENIWNTLVMKRGGKDKGTEG
ncbi:CaiF/GrlA family transcriptional regulator [Citrobacter arsenatis]|uniref:CaiF/GrlA family transcriptional regulator n=1 Tax=Citrobacter arsenatis TaxID=2546350 RepID=UPI00300DE8F9